MVEATEITAAAVRGTLLSKANAFCEKHDYSLSRVGKDAINDSKFLARVRDGDNFTIKTYQTVIDWIDAKDAELSQVAA